MMALAGMVGLAGNSKDLWRIAGGNDQVSAPHWTKGRGPNPLCSCSFVRPCRKQLALPRSSRMLSSACKAQNPRTDLLIFVWCCMTVLLPPGRALRSV